MLDRARKEAVSLSTKPVNCVEQVRREFSRMGNDRSFEGHRIAPQSLQLLHLDEGYQPAILVVFEFLSLADRRLEVLARTPSQGCANARAHVRELFPDVRGRSRVHRGPIQQE